MQRKKVEIQQMDDPTQAVAVRPGCDCLGVPLCVLFFLFD